MTSSAILPPPATLEVVHKNRLGLADITLWVDDTKMWSDQIGTGKNLIKRFAGDEVRHTLTVPAGRHKIAVHIKGRSMDVDARSWLEGELDGGSTRSLRVTLNPYTEKLSLKWIE